MDERVYLSTIIVTEKTKKKKSTLTFKGPKRKGKKDVRVIKRGD